MSRSIEIVRTAERPDWELWLTDSRGELIDLSSGYTFELKIGARGQAAVVTKTTGITGSAGSDTEPNVLIEFTAGELDDLTSSSYVAQLTATTGGLDRIWQFTVKVVNPVL